MRLWTSTGGMKDAPMGSATTGMQLHAVTFKYEDLQKLLEDRERGMDYLAVLFTRMVPDQ